MRVAPARDWNVFQQIFAEHWNGFKHAHPRYQTAYDDGLVAKMLACGNPALMGYVGYRCLHCGQGTHRGAMNCKSSLCLRCAKVYVDNWVSQVSQVLHEGVIYRHIILTVPAMLVMFPLAADNVSRPLVSCLKDLHQTVVRSRIRFSAPR
ncbi:MAG TPA: transposase zinc-binding domain-containing protein [Candidatus Saccharimonadia bacterium]|nr:transposase zinc-binding domain-containing protein [Candidatus Saccharimonadia bacterium]